MWKSIGNNVNKIFKESFFGTPIQILSQTNTPYPQVNIFKIIKKTVLITFNKLHTYSHP